MKQFEIRFLDRFDVPVFSRAFAALDDLEALDEAERLCKTHTVEVWQGNHRVARVKKGNAPLTTEDRYSL